MDHIEVSTRTIDQREVIIDKKLLRRRAFIYLAFVYGLVLLAWILSIVLPNPSNQTTQSIKVSYSLWFSFFSFFPLLASFFTRLITKDKSHWMIKPNFLKNWKTYLIAAFLPSALIFLSATLYFMIFPYHLDVTAVKLIETYGKFGVPSNLPHTVSSIIKIGIVGVLISPFIIPVAIFAFGEEIGWRGYLLPILLKLMSKQKAILLNGALWGLGHAPLILFGLNYGRDYWGAPYLGMIAMTLVCVVLGLWLSYVTIKTNSIIPASVLHGSVNIIGEFPALVAISGINPLLGPNPTGIIGMFGLLGGGLILLRLLDSR